MGTTVMVGVKRALTLHLTVLHLTVLRLTALHLTALHLTAPHMMALRRGATRNGYMERKKGTTVTTNMDTMEVTEAMEIVAMDTDIMETTIMAIAVMVGVKRALDPYPTH